MHAYIINLAGAGERWAHCERTFANQGCALRRIEAIDGRTIPVAKLAEVYDAPLNRRRYFTRLHPGEIGCFLSHRKAWIAVRDSGEPFGLVAEDDIDLLGDLGELAAALSQCDLDFDLLQLDGVSSGAKRQIGTLPHGSMIMRPALPSLNAAGYIVSRRGAERLLAAFPRIHLPIDVHFQRWWDVGLHVVSLEPPLIRQNEILQSQSTLKARKTKPGFTFDKLRRELFRPFFRKRLQRDANAAWNALPAKA